MATDDCNADLQIKSDKKEITDTAQEATVSQQSEDTSKFEECMELTDPTAPENRVSVNLEPDSSKMATEDEGKINTVETTDGTKIAEKIDSVVEGTTTKIDSIVEGTAEKTDSVAEGTTNIAEASTTSKPDEIKSDAELKKRLDRRRGRRGGRGVLVRKLATLNLPDGIILVKDRRYTGYHCTFCNCVLRSLITVKAHVGGKWHKRTLQIKDVNEDKKGKVPTPTKSTGSSPKDLPKVPLKSSLEEYLSTTKSAIVGLSYIIETQRPNKKPTFQCNLCEVSYVSDDIKEHISGMKHCLMYLKLVKPTKLAELLAKQLSKAEKNKEIAKLSTELEKENGRGEITVKTSLPKETTVSRQPGSRIPSRFQTNRGKTFGRPQRGGRSGRGGNRFITRPQAVGNRSNRIFTRPPSTNQRNRNFRGARRGNLSKSTPQKRRNDGLTPARKRQLLERDFQAQMQHSMARAQNSYFSGGWGMGNEPMNLASYQNEGNFYPNYSNFYPPSYGEKRRPFNRQGYMNESYNRRSELPERESYRRERHDDRQPYWSDRRDNFSGNKPRNYNRSVSPVRRVDAAKDSNNQLSALKRLAGFNVTSDEDAGVVINAINSLTNSFMNYKLRDLSGPVQQLLQKSLKGNDLTSLLNPPEKSSGSSSRDRYGERSSSSQGNRDWGISQIAKPQNWLF